MSCLRDLMPALANKHYFNYGGQGPLPTPSLEAITTSWQKIQELGPFTNKVWPYITNEIKTTKEHLAKLCSVSRNRIALTENVTSGCVLPLLGLPFSPGDRLLISDCEHPGIVSACKELARRNQLNIDILSVQQLRNGVDKQANTEQCLLEALEVALKPKTRIVVLSHILWNTGQSMSIPSVAKTLSKHPNRPFLLVDAAQSFGQIPIQGAANAADIYAFTGHKWACGPEGLGGVSLSERVLAEARPTLIGWRGLQHEGPLIRDKSDPFYLDSRRFEVATSCVPLLAGLRYSLKLLGEEGTEIERLIKVQEYSSQLWNKINNLEGAHPILKGVPPSGLISFTLSQREPAKEIVKLLGRENFWIRDLEDPECLRACVHVTTNSEEIQGLIDAMKSLTFSA